MRQNDQNDRRDEFPVSKLLRLKRYEQPPPEYFEKFLCEFQQRERSELLRSPAWHIALEQALQELRGLFTVSQLSYAGASFAVLVVAGAMTLHILQHPGGNGSSLALNERAPSQQAAAAANVQPAASPAQSRELAGLGQQFTLNPLNPQIRVDTFPAQPSQPGATNLHPRYILDARPASYEPPSRF